MRTAAAPVPLVAIAAIAVASVALPARLARGEEQVSGLEARHRAGQTFLTWREVDPTLLDPSISAVELKALRQRIERERRVSYRIYRSARPIASVDGLEPIARVGPLTAWNAEYHGISPGAGHQARRYVVDEGRGPVEPGTGIYVHSPDAPGKAYYAVTASVDGVERTELSGESSLAEPVEESTGPGEPVLQRVERPQEANTIERPELHYFVRWEAPPRANVPGRPFDYRVGVPPDVRRPAPLGLHLHCWGANLDGGYIWWYRGAEGAMLVSSNQIPYDWWVAYHEKHGIEKDLRGGVTRDYTVRRLLAFADWVARRWEIDPARVFIAGASMGGSGASMIALRYPQRFAYALSSVGVHIARESPQFKSSYEAACGREEVGILHESGLRTFDYLDNAFLLLSDPARDMPFLSFANGKNDAGIGWAQAVKFARALQETRQPHLFTWGEAGHGERVYVPTASGGGDGGPGLAGTHDIRLDRSLPAFTRSSLDDDPGSGDPADGDPRGQLNLYLRWDPARVTDEDGRWEATLYLIPGAPEERCATDVTPRRTRRFKPAPGERFLWASTALASGRAVQSGEVVADRWGLVTLPAVEVTKGRNRIAIQRPREGG